MNNIWFRKVYKQLIERAKMENRVKNNENYYEKHHILPDFMFKDRKRKGPKGHLIGNPNNKNNIVLLTPREHFISHILLYKIYKDTRYEYSAGSALIFFTSKVIEKTKHPRYKEENICDSKKYEKYRKIGITSISKARTGTMPAVDAITKISVGSVSVDHPKVKSGEWVHHSKGKKASATTLKNRPSTKGSCNSNYKQLTDEMEKNFIMVLDTIKDKNGVVKSKEFYETYNGITIEKRKKISSRFILNKFENFNKFLYYINNKHNKNYVYLGNRYIRSKNP